MNVVEDVAHAVAEWTRQGRRAVIGRVVDIQGFSTWAGDELIAVDESGTQHGDVLGRPGASRIQEAATALLAGPDPDRLDTVVVEIQGADVAAAGLACGGRAEVLLQPAAAIPPVLWDLLAERAPAALLTRIEGPTASPAGAVVAGDGRSWGRLTSGPLDADLVAEAAHVLGSGHSATRRIDHPDGTVLVEAWVPAPRLVVVGGGDLAAAISTQAGLLGWETESTEERDGATRLLDWAGSSAALVVLSHDPHLDTPAIELGLERNVPYVGALGSRKTQSRRLERLRAAGVSEAQLDRIHRPIGLDLGARSGAEVALAICAELLASHCGRDARPLRGATGPIHDRPVAAAVTTASTA